MSHVFGPWPCLLVVVALAGSTSNALAAAPHKHVQPAKKLEVASAARPERKAAAKTEAKKTKHAERVAAKRHKKAGADDRSTEKAEPQLTGDAAVMQATPPMPKRNSSIPPPKSSRNGSSFAIRNRRPVSAAMRRSYQTIPPGPA
jgi:hypothetical protein